MRKKKLNFKPFVIVFLLIIIIIIGFQLFTAAKFETILAAHGEVVDGFWADVLILRDEKVIRSPFNAKVNLLADEGERISSGQKVAEVTANKQRYNFYNHQAGIISFAVDGLEEKINIENMNQINLNQFDEIKGNYQHLLTGDKIKKNEALFRIINNFQLYLLVEVPKNQVDRFRINELIFLKDKNFEQLFEARIFDIRHSLNKSFFYIKVEQFIPRWLNIRWADLNIIKNIYRGIKIPRKAVFTQPSGKGILKVSGYNKYEFQEISIIDGNEEFVIVRGLEIGEEIITNPEDFNYGREVQ